MRAFHLSACRIIGLAYAGLMTASAAENPCVPRWVPQWVQEPVLGDVTCPGQGQIPDQCVGTVVVSATVAPSSDGVMHMVDANDCPDSEPGDPASVPISPVNGWSIYTAPPGTTPTGGSGATANLTVLHGGNVVVQFTNYAKVISPAWEAQKSCKNYPFRVFEVVDLTPDHGTEVDDGDGDSRTKIFIVCGTLVPPNHTITIGATPNPDADASDLPDCWSLTGDDGVTIVDKKTATIDGSEPKKCTVECTAGTSMRRTTVIVLRTDFKSITFTSDHGIMKDNNTDWTDSGTVYGTPEWIRSPARNYPISHTKGAPIILTATVKVEPARGAL